MTKPKRFKTKPVQSTIVEVRMLVQLQHDGTKDVPQFVKDHCDPEIKTSLQQMVENRVKHVGHGKLLGVRVWEPHYTLAGNQLALYAKDAYEVPPAPCIFCGKKVKHINDGGHGFLVHALLEGEAQQFLYHASPVCTAVKQYGRELWRCGCTPDYIECVGLHCPACDNPRHLCPPSSSTQSCPKCERDLAADETFPGVIVYRCPCKWVGYYDAVLARLMEGTPPV